MTEHKIIRFCDAVMRASETEDMAVEGYALKFERETQIGSDDWGWIEKISRTALVGAKLDNVVLNFNHSFDSILARTTNNSLQLNVDDIGLKVIARVIDTSIGRDVFKLIQNGLINRMSFAAVIKESVWTTVEDDSGGMDRREITKFDRFYDVSAVTFPAYDDTIISARGCSVVDGEAAKHFAQKAYRQQIDRLNKILEGSK